MNEPLLRVHRPTDGLAVENRWRPDLERGYDGIVVVRTPDTMRFDFKANPLYRMWSRSPIDTTQLLNPLSWVVAVLPSSQVT